MFLRIAMIADKSALAGTRRFEAKRVEVSLKEQTVTAYEGDQVVLHTKVSTGVPSYQNGSNGIPTTTPTGGFNLQPAW